MEFGFGFIFSVKDVFIENASQLLLHHELVLLFEADDLLFALVVVEVPGPFLFKLVALISLVRIQVGCVLYYYVKVPIVKLVRISLVILVSEVVVIGVVLHRAAQRKIELGVEGKGRQGVLEGVNLQLVALVLSAFSFFSNLIYLYILKSLFIH